MSARLEQYRRLLSATRFVPVTYFGAFPSWLPFRLGESKAEAVIPYALDGDLVAAAEAATAELFELLRRRREGDHRPTTEVGLNLESKPRLRLPPARLFPGRLGEGSFVASVANRTLRSDPLLDAGLVEAWLARGTAGSGFVERLHTLASQALEADLGAGAGLPYLYMVALAVSAMVDGLKRQAKAGQIRGVTYERLEKALGLLFHATSNELLDRLLSGLPARGLPFETESYALRIRLALNPLLFCAIRKSVLANDLNPYALSAGWAATLEPLVPELLGPDSDPRGMEGRLLQRITRDRPLAEAAEAEARIQLLREAVFLFLARFDAFDPALTDRLAAAVVRDDDLARLPSQARELQAQMAPLAHRKLEPAEANALRSLRMALRGEDDRARRINFAAAGFLAYALDRFSVEHLDLARSRLRNRRDEFAPERIRAEYEQGKLYLLAGDGQPFFKATGRATQGHLFIDLKGFTQRTYRAKELVMAEFMRAEFYGPILRAARNHAAAGIDGRSGITLQNLLGDAAVFSGDMRALVGLAREIQQILAGYAEKLRSRLGAVAAEAEARQRTVRAEVEERAARLKSELATLDAEIARKRRLPPAAQEELLWDLYARRAFSLERQRSESELAGLGAEVERLRRLELQLATERTALIEMLDKVSATERQAHVDERVCLPERARRAELQRELASLAEKTRVVLRALEEEARSAGGFGLEAGLFVTYGAAAERIEFEDPLFGKMHVAIAEKINEAARGTARAAPIRARLDSLLQRARQRRPEAELPFSVYVDQTYSLVFSPELTALVDEAVSAQDAARAHEAAGLLASGLEHDVAKMMGRSDPAAPGLLTVLNDIYNVGEAFSEEAVEAYVSETRGTRFSFRKGLSVSELHPEIRERFLFTSDQLQLQVSVPLVAGQGDALVFRLAGHVHFRGFEAKRATAVYELLRRESAFMRLVMQHHLRAWVDEARASSRG